MRVEDMRLAEGEIERVQPGWILVQQIAEIATGYRRVDGDEHTTSVSAAMRPIDNRPRINNPPHTRRRRSRRATTRKLTAGGLAVRNTGTYDSQDRIFDLVDRKTGGIDQLGVGGLHERRFGAGAVAVIALAQLAGDGFNVRRMPALLQFVGT